MIKPLKRVKQDPHARHFFSANPEFKNKAAEELWKAFHLFRTKTLSKKDTKELIDYARKCAQQSPTPHITNHFKA